MESLPDLSSDEDDMFIKPGAGSGFSSIYSASIATTNPKKRNESDDDDDEMDELPQAPVKRKRRGRPKRSGRSAAEETIDLDAEDEPEGAGQGKPVSVFSASPGINTVNAVDVDALEEDEVNSAAARTLLQTALVLERAKGKRGGPSLEARLEEEATREARRHAEEVERNMKSEKRATQHKNVSRSTLPQKDSNFDGGTRQEEQGSAIKLRVRYEETVVKMKILKSDPLKKMLKPFCDRVKLNIAKAVMEVDGEEVEDEDTPDTYDLEDDNLVEVRFRK